MKSLLFIKISALVFSSFLVTGCASALVSAATAPRTETTKTLVAEDSIVAIGRPKVGDESPRKSDLVLVGLANTYTLKNGFEDIEKIAEDLDPKFLQVNADRPIDLMISGDRFYGSVVMVYGGNGFVYTDDSVSKLTRLGFSKSTIANSSGKSEVVYRRNFDLAGKIYAKVNNLDDVSKKFSKNRPVRFYTETSTEIKDAGKELGKAAALPFAIAFDVVTLPIQLLMFTAYLSHP